MLLTVVSETADIIGNPSEHRKISNNDSQLLYGEEFQVEESHGAYVYGHSILDGYKGYVERGQLIKEAPKSNSFVNIRSTHLYPEPDFKSRPSISLSFLSRLTTTKQTDNSFTQLHNGSWIYTAHIAPQKSFLMPGDMAKTAEFYLGTPYLYGGRSTFGIDCSALIQQIMIAHGLPCPPRDTGEQESSFGTSVNNDKLQRNDIIFFKDHVGIMLDEERILNATARHMSTVIENVRDLEKIYDGITHVARL